MIETTKKEKNIQKKNIAKEELKQEPINSKKTHFCYDIR